MCLWYVLHWMWKNNDELERFLKQNLLRGFSRSPPPPLLKHTQIQCPSTGNSMHTSFVLTPCPRMHMHWPLSVANTANAADLPESQPALQLPPFLQIGNPQLPDLTPHANAVKHNPSLHHIQSFRSLPSLIVRSLCRQRPGSGSCRRRQWPRSFCQRCQCREACPVPSWTHPTGHSCWGHKNHRQWWGAAVKKRISQKQTPKIRISRVMQWCQV